MGFDGKTLIHPNQIGPCNNVFSPSADEVAHARKLIAAFELPENKGKGVVQIDGRAFDQHLPSTCATGACVVQADERAQRQHDDDRVSQTEPAGDIDIFRARDPILDELDRLDQHGVEQAVHGEARHEEEETRHEAGIEEPARRMASVEEREPASEQVAIQHVEAEARQHHQRGHLAELHPARVLCTA